MNLGCIPDNPYLLLTPGPLSTSKRVRAALLQDWCTWDDSYRELVEDVRTELLRVAGAPSQTFSVVPMQGSGTFAVEAAIGSIVGPDDALLVLVNGAYGERIQRIAEYYGITTSVVDYAETEPVTASAVNRMLRNHPDTTHVAVVHCETSSGILNPLDDLVAAVREAGRTIIVDAMSSFGGIPVDMGSSGIDVLVSSANKCIQGVPGFGFVIARRTLLERSRGNARSLSLDLYDQWRAMEETPGKWRFTSPTHAVHAFREALRELEAEGGVVARWKRYCDCHQTLLDGMRALGFKTYIPREYQSPIITTFAVPGSVSFDAMYAYLKERGFVIYPGKLTDADTFRVGSIGDVYPSDMKRLTDVLAKWLRPGRERGLA